MADVSAYINGRSYSVACDDGQEERVLHLAGYIDQKARAISHGGGIYTESHMLVLAALMVADELLEAQETLADQRTPAEKEDGKKEEEKALVQLLEKTSKRIDALATRLNQVQ